MSTKTRFSAVLAIAVLALAGCAQSPAADAGKSITATDTWVKSASTGMSAAFGTIENTSDREVTVVSVSSDASSKLELHETVANAAGEMVMQEKKGGFVIPAHGKLTLAPGANHIMLMNLTKPIVAGDTAKFTLTFADKSTFDFTAPVKDYSGANEKYEGGDHSGHMPQPSSSSSHGAGH